MTSTEITRLVNNHLDNLTFYRQPHTLYAPIKYVLSLGGKRIRPVLTLLGYQLFLPNVEKALDVACALEIYHNYTLLHDDLMDNAELRRGCPTVHKKWDANTAILSGDSMLVLAYEKLAKCPKEDLSQCLSLFTETALLIGEGQQYDMEFESRNDVTETEYIEMIRLKTSVLLACALKMGAILAGASNDVAQLLYQAGEQIGLAFQLQDDYLDVYGDPALFGKNIGGDILCNKKTFMLINAFHHATPKQLQELQHWISLKNFHPQEKIEAITQLYNTIGIRQMAQARITQYFDEGITSLRQIENNPKAMNELITYINDLMDRKK